jgi:type I restriction enzyme, S subunit
MTQSTPPTSWMETTIGGCLADEFPGAWGSEPGRNGPNAHILRSTNLDDDGHIDFATAAKRWIDEPHLSQRRLRDGDVLLEASGGGPGKPVGRVAQFQAPDSIAYLSSNFFRTLRPDETKVHSRYLAWRLLDLYRQPKIWNFQQQTTGIINLKTKDYLQQRFRLPEKLEQSRIAAVLDTVDETITKAEAVIAKLRQVRAGLLHDLLTRGLDPNGQLRDPVAHPEHFQSSPLGPIPKEWVYESLGERLQRIGGVIQTGPFGSQLHAHEYTTEGVPVIMPQDVLEGSVSIAQIARIPAARADELKRHRVRLGDLIFARRGDLSRCAAITTREVGWLCGTGCLLMRFGESTLSPHWLSLAYRHDNGQRQIAARAVGTTMVNLNTKLLAHLRFAFPSKDEQSDVEQRVADADAHIHKESAHLSKLGRVKSGVMTDLLTGRVRVPETIGTAL